MILLSFDIEEFDMPLEYNGSISFEDQLSVSRKGLIHILRILKKHQIKATFFSTVVFAENNQDLIQELISEGHELASHTWHHSQYEDSHLKTSKEKLQELFNTEVKGLRLPRMMQVTDDAVKNAGYLYNSSINPTYLPGRYNNLNVSKIIFKQNNLLHLPASVSPLFRIPLFWLSFHNFPLWFYQYLVKKCIQSTGYLNIYFHPWEFADIQQPIYKLPQFTTKNTGKAMEDRFEEFLRWAIRKNYSFGTLYDFVKQYA